MSSLRNAAISIAEADRNRRGILGYAIVLCIFLAVLAYPERLSDTDDQTAANEQLEDNPLSQALESLQDPDNLGQLNISGQVCQELDADGRRQLLRELALRDTSTVQAIFAARDPTQASALVQRLSPSADPIVQSVVYVQVATLMFGLGRTQEAAAWLDRAPDLYTAAPCFAADQFYVSGRIAERTGQIDAARASYAQAVEANPLHIPAHLERVRIGLRQAVFNDKAIDAVGSLTVLAQVRGARRFAADLVVGLQAQACQHEGCLYLRAALLAWTDQLNAAEDALDKLDTFCAFRSCNPFVPKAAQTFRETLAEKQAARAAGQVPS